MSTCKVLYISFESRGKTLSQLERAAPKVLVRRNVHLEQVVGSLSPLLPRFLVLPNPDELTLESFVGQRNPPNRLPP